MSLLVLMYHRACACRQGNSAEVLDAHFQHVAASYPNVLPGESLHPGTLNICLSFDDGYFDFYAVVFPLLQKYRLRALLAIPPLMVRERTDASTEARLRVSSEEAFAHPSNGGFCIWPELEEMAASGHVAMAAHGFSHLSLLNRYIHLDTEIQTPQIILRSRLDQKVESFVFPFGAFSSRAVKEARQRYRYVFRIGGALNYNWDGRILYRVDADAMENAWSLFTPGKVARYRARSLWNRLRFR